MACYHPIAAYQPEAGAPVKLGGFGMGLANLALPCGSCIGCKTDRATQWANRCTHEASIWENNSFITLTYDDEHLPPEGHLSPYHLTTFLKRMRKHADSNRSVIDRDRRANLRYFACGEYGTARARPHYHLLVFNCAFRDRYHSGESRSGPTYTSEQLAKLWTYGIHHIGSVTARSAAYVAQYNLKNVGRGDHDADGVYRQRPFLRMSRRPAIGAEWLAKYADDLQHGYLVSPEGRQHPIPRYYREKIKERLPELRALIEQRIEQARINNPSDRRSRERLEAQETIHKRRKELTENRNID